MKTKRSALHSPLPFRAPRFANPQSQIQTGVPCCFRNSFLNRAAARDTPRLSGLEALAAGTVRGRGRRGHIRVSGLGSGSAAVPGHAAQIAQLCDRNRRPFVASPFESRSWKQRCASKARPGTAGHAGCILILRTQPAPESVSAKVLHSKARNLSCICRVPRKLVSRHLLHRFAVPDAPPLPKPELEAPARAGLSREPFATPRSKRLQPR